jgi:hypothetical protein
MLFNVSWTRKSRPSQKCISEGRHRFEHWYRDNQVYFITSRCRDGRAMFDSDDAMRVFWDRFDHYAEAHGFTPWVTTLLNNHYHTLGYLRVGDELGPMKRKIHGSVAKLVNDLHEVRLVPFWVDRGQQDYFDGCIRDEKQCRRAYRYTLTQAERHGLRNDWREYPHTRVSVELQRGVARALELKAFLEGVPYRRYLRGRKELGH